MLCGRGQVLQKKLFGGWEEGTCYVKLRAPCIALFIKILSKFTVIIFFHVSMVKQTCSLYHLGSIKSINPAVSASPCNICIWMSVPCQFSRQYWTCSNPERTPTRATESSNSELAYLDAGTLCECYMSLVLDYRLLSCSGLHDEREYLEELRIGRCLNKTNQNTKTWGLTVKSIQEQEWV